MLKKDRCLALLNPDALSEVEANRVSLALLMETLALTPETPTERIIRAVQDEIADLVSRAECEVKLQMQSAATSTRWHQTVLEVLRTQAFYFPVEELRDLAQTLPSAVELLLLKRLIKTFLTRHALLEARIGWLLHPLSSEEVARLDPLENCDEIYHFLTYEFRTEMKIYALLYEMRAIVVANTNAFFLSTGEFTKDAVKRTADTFLLVSNILEWGEESYRGRTCIQKINEIHGRYHLPNESFLLVLCGIMFVPEDWNSRLGWRPLTQIEKEGWFHAIAKVGRAMKVQNISTSYSEMKEWYIDYCQKYARYSPLKRKLFDQTIGQVLSTYPESTRPLIFTAILAGMDEPFLEATGYSAPPNIVQTQVQAAFSTLGHLGAILPRIPWLRTIQSSIVYPLGYRVEELGVQRRSTSLPKNSEKELEQLPAWTASEVGLHQTQEDLWVTIHGEVYDLTRFAENHPGGAAILLQYAGKDASEAFEQAHHSAATRELMKNFRIGRTALPVNEPQYKLNEGKSRCPFSGAFSEDFAR